MNSALEKQEEQSISIDAKNFFDAIQGKIKVLTAKAKLSKKTITGEDVKLIAAELAENPLNDREKNKKFEEELILGKTYESLEPLLGEIGDEKQRSMAKRIVESVKTAKIEWMLRNNTGPHVIKNSRGFRGEDIINAKVLMASRDKTSENKQEAIIATIKEMNNLSVPTSYHETKRVFMDREIIDYLLKKRIILSVQDLEDERNPFHGVFLEEAIGGFSKKKTEKSTAGLSDQERIAMAHRILEKKYSTIKDTVISELESWRKEHKEFQEDPELYFRALEAIVNTLTRKGGAAAGEIRKIVMNATADAIKL